MKFHLPSFLLGCVTGAGIKALAPRLRPLLVEVTSAGYAVLDVVRAQLARRREDLEDLLAEGRARVTQRRRAAELHAP
jgi:hypothetical protein